MNYNDIEILIVEDSIDDAALITRALTKNGFTNKLLHVKDGAEALAFLYGKEIFNTRNIFKQPKLILLDLKMPKVSGLQVLEKIKFDANLKSIPVVVFTSSNEDSDVKKCYEFGANCYIVKPVGSDEFFFAIKQIGFFWLVLSQLPD